eukprot:12401379-Karenia_brevis.AAC.1
MRRREGLMCIWNGGGGLQTGPARTVATNREGHQHQNHLRSSQDMIDLAQMLELVGLGCKPQPCIQVEAPPPNPAARANRTKGPRRTRSQKAQDERESP